MASVFAFVKSYPQQPSGRHRIETWEDSLFFNRVATGDRGVRCEDGINITLWLSLSGCIATCLQAAVALGGKEHARQVLEFSDSLLRTGQQGADYRK
jgi:hypothetical protein